MKRVYVAYVLGLSILFSACNRDEEVTQSGQLTLQFNHCIDGVPVEFDQMLYTNAAGNNYELSEIQWFISDVTLTMNDEQIVLDKDDFAHYVDTDLSSTWTWEIQDPIPAGTYSSISFIFGIRGEKNRPYTFPNPPESNMVWPYNLGGDYGGYHYMKMNGFWLNPESQRNPFNAHLGVGQLYDANNNITGFIQNWFTVELPNSKIEIAANRSKIVTVTMNVESWFETPETFDFNVYGGKIMTNQEAMSILKNNGVDAFTCTTNNP